MHELLRGLSTSDIRKNVDFHRITPDTSIVKDLEHKLGETVFGQERAVSEVAHAITRAMAGLGAIDRPLFSGLFLGEPGVGKTEMGRGIAKVYYEEGAEKHLLVLDSAQFNERHQISRLIGAPQGYVGYGDTPLVTPELLAKPNVIVVDEIEKGCREWQQLWLGVLDRGTMSVPIGTSTYRNVENIDLNFAHSLILFTSNIGSGEIRQTKEGKGHIGFGTDTTPKDLREVGLKAFKEYFKFMPEFPNRLDSVVVFDSLTDAVFLQLVDKFVAEYTEGQAQNGNFFALTKEAKDYVVAHTDKHFGGRELRRALEKYIITPAAEVKMSLRSGTPFIVDVEDEKVVFWTSSLFEEQREAEEVKKNSNIVQLPDIKRTNDTEGTSYLTAEELALDTEELKIFLERINHL